MTKGALGTAGLTGIAALLAVALPCAALAAKPAARQPQRVTVTSDADRLRAAGLTPFSPPLIDTARFTFTAPGRGASTARLDTVERAFRFTPSGQPGSRKSVSIGVTSRAVIAASDATRVAPEAVAAPAAYNVGLSVGWRGFAVGGSYSRLDSPVTALGPNRREAADLGVSYRAKNWKTALQVAAESGSPLLLTPQERRYSVELGGAYAVAPRLSVNGGVRYRLAPEQPSVLDNDRADSSVYLGTAFSF